MSEGSLLQQDEQYRAPLRTMAETSYSSRTCDIVSTMKLTSGWIGIATIAGVVGTGCSRAAEPTASVSVPINPNMRCVVLLHGKGRKGERSTTVGDVTYLRPGGNGEGWGGRQWIYYPDARYREVVSTVGAAVDSVGCGQIIVQGFSNGASAAAKLYCRGERFGGRVRGYVIDDPVPDNGVAVCTPPPDVRVRVYWTGALSIASDRWSCASQDWTCEGGQTIGIDKYAQALRTEVMRSIHSTHTEYQSPPESTAWFTPR